MRLAHRTESHFLVPVPIFRYWYCPLSTTSGELCAVLVNAIIALSPQPYQPLAGIPCPSPQESLLLSNRETIMSLTKEFLGAAATEESSVRAVQHDLSGRPPRQHNEIKRDRSAFASFGRIAPACQIP